MRQPQTRKQKLVVSTASCLLINAVISMAVYEHVGRFYPWTSLAAFVCTWIMCLIPLSED